MSEMVGPPNAFRFEIDDAVRQYADMVYRLAVLNTGSEQEAQDAFQEVFLKLFRHKDSIQSEEHLKAWLIRVTVNQCRSMAASAWNRRNVSLEVVAEAAAPQDDEDYSEVYDAVRTLPDKYREVIHLFYYEQLPISRIAQILGRNEATVKTHLARGRSLLKEKLKGSFRDG
jgi:RNA polymerase sigma-70 factor (ECF subfamily)